MIITIDTTKDSQNDIRRAISLLQQYLDQHVPYQQAPYTPPQQVQQPQVGMNLFDMPLPSQQYQQQNMQPVQQTIPQQQTPQQQSFMNMFDTPLPSQQYQQQTMQTIQPPQQPATSFLFDNIMPSTQQTTPQTLPTQSYSQQTIQPQNKRIDKFILETY